MHRINVICSIYCFITIFLLLPACKTLRSPAIIEETESGLKYSVIKKGDGAKPEEGDIITFHFVGMLEDNTEIENTRRQNRPVSVRFGTNQFIEGLNEGLAMMQGGDIYRFVIPPELAYGEKQVGKVEPGSTLIYEVELLDVKPGIKVIEPKKETVKKTKTPSGLEYSIFEKGKGARIFEDMVVKFNYVGFFGDNVVFDSSVERGKPLEAKLGDRTLIKGLEEGLTYLHVGDHARFWIPSELAYGNRGRGIIPPDTDLVFDIEVLEAKEVPKPTPFDVSGLDTLCTDSGLQYIIVKEGYGDKPEPGQVVKVHYSAYLPNGYMFDSSLQRSDEFRVIAGKGLMIKGWDEGILLMNKGAKFRFIIPYYLAFGSRRFNNVPAYSTVIFDIELIDIEY